MDDKTFRISCAKGRLEVAKWLYSLGGVNIYAWDNYAFKYSRERGHSNVLQWLKTLQ
jgi:hypothetical protein